MALENITTHENPIINDSASKMLAVQSSPDLINDYIFRHIIDNGKFKKLKKGAKNERSRKQLEELVLKYSKDLSDDYSFKRAFSNYHVGKLGKILGAGTVASGLMYSLPGRFYPSINGIGDTLKYFIPFVGPMLALGDLGKYTVLKSIKGLGGMLFSPFLYATGAYTLYRVVKGIIKHRKNNKKKQDFVKGLSDLELENILAELKEDLINNGKIS